MYKMAICINTKTDAKMQKSVQFYTMHAGLPKIGRESDRSPHGRTRTSMTLVRYKVSWVK